MMLDPDTIDELRNNAKKLDGLVRTGRFTSALEHILLGGEDRQDDFTAVAENVDYD